jgi:hypothetical protein
MSHMVQRYSAKKRLSGNSVHLIFMGVQSGKNGREVHLFQCPSSQTTAACAERFADDSMRIEG